MLGNTSERERDLPFLLVPHNKMNQSDNHNRKSNSKHSFFFCFCSFLILLSPAQLVASSMNCTFVMERLLYSCSLPFVANLLAFSGIFLFTSNVGKSKSGHKEVLNSVL